MRQKTVLPFDENNREEWNDDFDRFMNVRAPTWHSISEARYHDPLHFQSLAPFKSRDGQRRTLTEHLALGNPTSLSSYLARVSTMTHQNDEVLSADLQKLTGSRTWLHRVKTPHWKPKHVRLYGNGTLRYAAPPGHMHLPASHLLIVPGGARRANHAEQIRYDQQYVFVVSAVALGAVHDRDASRHTLFFAAKSMKEVDTWVEKVHEVSFARMEVQEDHPFVHPFLCAWGHVLRLRLKDVIDVAYDMGFRLTEEHLSAVWAKIYGGALPKGFDPDHFVRIMTKIAINDSVESIKKAAGSPSNAETGPVPSDMLAIGLGHNPVEMAKIFESHGVERCNLSLLMHIVFHPSNSIVDPVQAAELHDMTRPLNHYFISSSHNTYLTGDQLKSDSTAEMYRIVLEKGCRCVEIDAWDGDEGEPIVRHGHTATSSETLEKVLQAIRDNAFVHGNPYPVILSIENHLSKPQQLVAAKLITTILGDTLFAPTEDQGNVNELPSPESLRGKIVLKAKKCTSLLKNDSSFSSSFDGCEGDDSDTPGDSDDPLSSSTPVSGRVSREPLTPASSTSQTSVEPSHKIMPELSDLTFLAGGNRKVLTALWKEGNSGKDRFIAASCVSINEKKLCAAFTGNCGAVVREYNSHGFTRVYPKGSRVSSSNYNPMLGHFLGCQIVALNWQCNDGALNVNEARFLANRGYGYVLEKQIPEAEQAGTLQIQIMSAFLLPKCNKRTKAVKREIVDPYCVVKAYDTSFDEDGDCCTFKFSTDVVKSNGFAPSWQQSVSIPIVNRAFAVLTFKLFDRDRTSTDDLIGYLAVPTYLLRTGVRSLPLNGIDGMPLAIPGTSQRPALLCAVRWK